MSNPLATPANVDRPRAAPAAGRWLAASAVWLGAFTWLGWGRFANPITDFGRDLYLAWRFSAGDVLGRDVFMLNGPLGAYINGSLFAAVGDVSLGALYGLNLLVTVAILATMYDWGRRVAGAGPAALATFAVTALFATGQYLTSRGSVNLLAPYSHEILYGLLFGGLAVRGLTARSRAAFVAGLAGALLWLTKTEFMVAYGAALAVRGVLTARAGRYGLRPLLAHLAGLGVGTAAVFGVHSVCGRLDPAALTQTWTVLVSVLAGSNGAAYYAAESGMARSLTAVLLGAAVEVAFLCGALTASAAASLAIRAVDRRLRWLGPVVGAVVGIQAGVLLMSHTNWETLTVGGALTVAVLLVRRSIPRSGRLPWAIALTWGVVLLAKVAKRPDLLGLASLLGLPVAFWLVAGSSALLARTRRRIRRPAGLALASVVVGLALASGWLTIQTLEARSAGVGTQRARVHTIPAAAGLVEAMLDGARTAAPASGPAPPTLTVFPEGGLANVLLGWPSPHPVVNVLPPHVGALGAARIMDAYRTAPPDVFVLVGYDMSAYGVPTPLGILPPLADWLETEYTVSGVRCIDSRGEPTTRGDRLCLTVYAKGRADR